MADPASTSVNEDPLARLKPTMIKQTLPRRNAGQWHGSSTDCIKCLRLCSHFVSAKGSAPGETLGVGQEDNDHYLGNLTLRGG
ncbi:hypothetical protein [Rhizobium binae]|uniref:hypothetical protein n=1 Tax=Rhizobium binae TaxID=1138190 RepID=UPI003DA8BD36